MESSRFSLFFMKKRAFKIFNKESKQDFYSAKKLLDKSFYLTNSSSDGIFIHSPYYGHVTFWFDYFQMEKYRSFFQTNEEINFICVHCGMKVTSI